MSTSTWERLATSALLAGVAFGLAGSAASAGTPARRSDASWRSFVSETGRFQAELPADPVVVRDPDHWTVLGTVRGYRYTVDLRDLLLVIEVHDLPSLARIVVPTDTVLEATREGVVTDVDAVEVQGGAITLQGLPARDFVYRLAGESPVFERALVVLVEGRLYVVTGQAAGRPGSSPELERFFASFRFWREGSRAREAAPAALADAP